ncbi:MAG: DUF1223 domain-containing protein, partial [Pseudomonadota bacterium]
QTNPFHKPAMCLQKDRAIASQACEKDWFACAMGARHISGGRERKIGFPEGEMNSSRWIGSFIAASAAAFFVSVSAAPASAQSAPESSANKPVLVELFLSQSCPMCPPAAELFPSYAARDDVVALTWHVDYWNMTTSPKGVWEDPFSKAAYTDRQKQYNMNIRQRSSIYTPQIIVNGEYQTVGANAAKIDALLVDAQTTTPLRAEADGDSVIFAVGESETGGNAYLVTFYKQATTDVTGGKNAGKAFTTRHVVKDVQPMGLVRKRGGEITAPRPADGEGCALLIQEPGQKRVIAAAYCRS